MTDKIPIVNPSPKVPSFKKILSDIQTKSTSPTSKSDGKIGGYMGGYSLLQSLKDDDDEKNTDSESGDSDGGGE